MSAPEEGISFTLDGATVQARAGESLLQAAQRHGVPIPHLCHKEGLRADGNCRACVVEIEGERVLAPSCCRNPTPGMVVHAQSKRAVRSRNMVLELLRDADVLIALKGEHGPTRGYEQKIRAMVNKEFPGATFYFQPADIVTQVLNFGLPAPINVEVVGRNVEASAKVARELRQGIYPS